MKIQVCTRKNDDAKFSFYPYILLTSAFFLLLVVIVYAVFPKVRYNNCQRLRLHFAANMLAAFVILSMNQLTDIGNMNMVACQVFGKYSSYMSRTFTLTFILQVSCNNFSSWKHLRS